MQGVPDKSGLKGQLEDLPLIDMLQIVAFSKKTGHLQIEGPRGKGGVVFNEGLVVCAYSWSTLKYMRRIRGAPAGPKTREALHKLIEYALQELAALQEGTFQFQVTPSIPTELGGTSIASLILDRGINPEFLLLELARDMDEDQKDASQNTDPDHDAAPAETWESGDEEPEHSGDGSDKPPELDSAPVVVRTDTSVLLVDDEAPVRQIVGTALRSAGYRVYTACSPAEGVGLASEIALTGERLLIVTDLGMPTTSGRSFRGGFELARNLKRNKEQLPVVLMADQLSPKARGRAKEFGICKIVLKPGLSKLDREQYEKDLQAFARTLIQMLPNLEQVAAAEQPTFETPRGEDKTSAPFLDFIASMTEQLLDPKRSVDVTQLVLEVACKYLERGILLVIKSETVSGLGGFGLASSPEASHEIARRIRFSINDAPLFAEVVYGGKTGRFSADHDFLQMTLYAAVGKGRANECVLLPMLNNSGLLVILYGDNAGSARPIGTLRGLELFMVQAGMMLENTFLHQKIRAMEQQSDRAQSEPRAGG